MQKSTLCSLPTYDPDRLLNELKDRLKAKTDSQLARILGVQAPVISKLRHRVIPVSAFVLIQMHEASHLTIKELRFLMGDEGPRFNDRLAYPASKPAWRSGGAITGQANIACSCKEAS